MAGELMIPASVVVAPAQALFFPELTSEELQTTPDHESFLLIERRQKVAALRRKGMTWTKIAAEVGVNSHNTVRRDLEIIVDGYRRLCAVDVGYLIADAIHEITGHMADLREQWERSKEPRKESSRNRRTVGRADREDGPLRPGETETISAKTKETLGDPRYAALWQQCWEKRCMLLGILNKADLKPAGPPPVKLVAGVDPAEDV